MFNPRPKHIAIEPLPDSPYYNAVSKLIAIPEIAKERSDQGIVKYMGTGCSEDIKIGDHVIFSGYTGTTIRIDNEIIIDVHEKFIKGKIVSDDVIVAGVFMKTKVDWNKYEARIAVEIDLYNNFLPRIRQIIAEYLNELYIPAPYETTAKFMALSHDSIRDRVIIADDRNKEQRDPVDDPDND